jgi:hypothetical protein
MKTSFRHPEVKISAYQSLAQNVMDKGNAGSDVILHSGRKCWRKPNKKWLVTLAMLVATTSLRLAQGSRPNFSGRWELDKTQTDFGSLPADDSAMELINHQEPRLTITQIWKNADGEHTLVWQLTTDGAENITQVNEIEIRSRTGWEDSKLVTDWKMKSGANLTEGKNVRFLSEDSNTQTVKVRQRSGGGEIEQHLVFVKKPL